MSLLLPTLSYTIENDVSEKLMERRVQAKAQNRKMYAIIVAVAILLVGLEMYGVQRRQKQNELRVGCRFLNMESDLNFCQEMKNVGNSNSGMVSTIPSEIGLLTQMSSLKIYGDVVAGTIPPTMGNLTQLAWLQIHSTRLSGTIPRTFGNLVLLQRMLMFDNPQLTGTIPSTLGNLTKLDMLYISNTQLGGPIPSTLGKILSLTELNLGYNQLTGTIPSTLAYLTHLEYLFLQNNTQLNGEIPSSLCSNSRISIYIDCDNIACSCCSHHNAEDGTVTECSVA